MINTYCKEYAERTEDRKEQGKVGERQKRKTWEEERQWLMRVRLNEDEDEQGHIETGRERERETDEER